MMQPTAGAAETQQQQAPQQSQHHPQQQQWMAMQMQHQYPAAAMMMQQQMHPYQHYPPQSYMPYPPPPQQMQAPLSHPAPPSSQQQQQQAQQQQSQSNEENKTIWVGDLLYWMDEGYLNSCFGHTGDVVSIKVIRNKQTGQSDGYGFVEFGSRATAESVLNFNGTVMPNVEQLFRLNWASFSMGDKRSDVGSDQSIFVGDLASDVTDTVLQETFLTRYPSVKGAKVVIDANTGRSKGYGFVRFGDDNERLQAMTEMNGAYCSSRPMRIGAATPRKSSGFQQQYHSQGQGFQSDGDLNNTTIFVGGLDPSVSDEDLRQVFSQYGDVASVKIPLGKGCGFVQFMNRAHAEEALSKLNGTVLGKQMVRLSWGRNPANKLPRVDQGNQWGGSYYGAQVYNGYGYAAPPQDSAMYGATYGAYPVYGNQQQVS